MRRLLTTLPVLALAALSATVLARPQPAAALENGLARPTPGNPHAVPGGRGAGQEGGKQWASWGVDYLKYDNCNNQNVDARTRYSAMRDALARTGRPIVYSICEWGRTGPPKVWEWGADV